MELFQLIAGFFQHLTSWLPRPFLLNVTERGVLFRRGQEPRLLEPGFHWHMPLMSSYERISILKDATEFEPVVLPTEDGKTIAIGFVIVWHIRPDNVIRSVTTSDDITAMVGEVGESLLPPLVMQYSFSELQKRIRGGRNLITVNDSLTQSAQDMLEEYGVTVDRARINFLAPARVLKHINNPLM